MNDELGMLKSLRIEWLWPHVMIAGIVSISILVFGFMTKSTILEVAGVLCSVATMAYAFMTKQEKEEGGSHINAADSLEPATSVPSPSAGRTLVFDDYRVGSKASAVTDAGQEPEVVPSSKTTLPVASERKGEAFRDMEIPDFFDLEAETSYTDVEPRSEFHSLLDKVLLVVKDVLFAHSVVYFWANKEKKEMVLESMATGDARFMKSRRFPMGEDLVSQVGLTGKPQIVGAVNSASELEVLPYYDEAPGVLSAVAVPVFYLNSGGDVSPVGTIVVDSLAGDQFGDETLAILGRFTKLVSVLIKSYTDKYDLLLDAELLASIRRMHDRIGSSPTEEGVLDALMDEANRLATWECLALVMYDEKRNGWTIQRVENKSDQPYVNVGFGIDPDASIVGEVILSNSIRQIDDLSAEHKPCFHAEQTGSTTGSLLCLPISSFNRCYGALVLESRRVGNFQKNETETMFRLMQNAAAMLEVVYMNDVVKEHVPVDHGTGALTKRHFERRLGEEVERATDCGTELSLVSLALDHADDQSQRYGPGAIEAMMKSVVGIVRSNLRAYDVIGRASETRMDVLLVNTAANDAYLWAEKVRKQIAGQIVVSGSRSFSTTVSMGICGLLDGMLVADLTEGTEHVLSKAIEHGGNLVRVH